METTIISVGFDKGEADFAVSSVVSTLSSEQYNKLRAMLVVAIGTMEHMYRVEQDKATITSSDLA